MFEVQIADFEKNIFPIKNHYDAAKTDRFTHCTNRALQKSFINKDKISVEVELTLESTDKPQVPLRVVNHSFIICIY